MLAALVLASCSQQAQVTVVSKGKVDYQLSPDETAMLDSIQKKTFSFF